MARLVYHIDDSSIAKHCMEKRLHALAPDCTVVYLPTAEDFISRVGQSGEQPWLVFSDWHLPGLSGIELLSWIRRHPKLHHTPVVIISSDTEQSHQKMAKSLGALDFLQNPVSHEGIANVLEKVKETPFDLNELYQLDQDFSLQSVHKIDELITALPHYSDEDLKKTSMMIHTIKGEARVLEFPVIAEFCHLTEGLLASIRNRKVWDNEKARELLRKIFQQIKAQCEQIRTANMMDETPQELREEIEFFGKVLEMGWAPLSDEESKNQTAANLDLKSLSEPLKDAFQVSAERFDVLQECFRKILQESVQINGIVSLILEKHPNVEQFKELADRVHSLNDDELKLFNILVELFTIPASKIRTYFEQSVFETSRILGKEARVDIQIDPGIEIDQVLFDALTFISTHLVRNAIDHGIESPQDRVAEGKDRVGHVRLGLSALRKHRVELVVEDDGRGVNREAVKKTALLKGHRTPEQIKAMNDQEIDELIFIEDLSTASRLSDISGRGIGLSSVKRIVQDRGGKVELLSVPGKGTTIKVMLPRQLKLLA